MSSISSVNGSGSGFSMMSGMKHPDPSKMVDDLFSKIDTTNKGYLSKSDLQSTLSQLSGSDSSNSAGSSSSSNSTNSSTTVDEMFKKLDSNNDDKITKDEMPSGMKKLVDALDSQFNQMRMNGTSQGGSGDSTTTSGMNRPDPSKMVDDLFSKLDTTNKGYLEKSDLQSALSQSPGSGSSSGTSSSPNVDEIFKKLDNNGDGKLTKSEMTSGMSSTAQASKGGGTPPPGGMPPPGAGGADSASGTSSTSATQSSSSTKTYDPADANQDGKVSEQEKIDYAQAKQDKASTSSTSTTSTNSDARVMKQIMDLMHAYSSFDSSTNNSGLSVTA
ncbi:EF hand repeat-containing protein [Nitrosomonas sp. Is79A3]|uniref:EF-hand domain-containing protein n=1 Tax=Nitrosomonas sp. (strain Is79A3) TaxID=261292 RepID=UPI000215CA81